VADPTPIPAEAIEAARAAIVAYWPSSAYRAPAMAKVAVEAAAPILLAAGRTANDPADSVGKSDGMPTSVAPVPAEALQAAWQAFAPGAAPSFTELKRIRVVLEAAAPYFIADALRDMADRIDRGPTFPLPPSVISALIRERADDITRETPHG